MLTLQYLIYFFIKLSINLIKKITTDDESVISVQNKEKCHSCGGFLSYFPIFSSQEDSINICGRCPPLQNSIQNIIYESSISSIHFPCLYQNEGCPAKLLPEDVPRHEENCGFRVINCSFSNCSWRGAPSTLIKHCENNHQEYILEEDKAYELYVSSDLNEIYYITFHNKQSLTIAWTFDSIKRKFGCLIRPYQRLFKKTKLFCRLTVEEENKGCYSIDFVTEEFAEISYTDVNINFQNEASFSIVVVLNFAESSQKLTQFFWYEDRNELFSLLKCSKCSFFLFSSFSSPLILNCCSCSAITGPLLNTVLLENMTNLLQYPCRYEAFGCTVTATLPLIKIHELCCPFLRS